MNKEFSDCIKMHDVCAINWKLFSDFLRTILFILLISISFSSPPLFSHPHKHIFIFIHFSETLMAHKKIRTYLNI